MKKLLFLFAFLFSGHFLFAQVNTFVREFIPTYTLNPSNYLGGVSYPNGNFLMTVQTKYSNPYDILLILLNPSGDTLWTKELDSILISNYENHANVAATFDGGCILFGREFNPGGNSFVLTRIDSTGNEMWSKKYFTIADIDTLSNVVQTKDSGFAFMGRTGFQFSTYGTSLIKTNSNGDTLWTRRYIAYNEEIIDFAEAEDGGFYLVGSGMFSKTDDHGNIQLRKQYSSSTANVQFSGIEDIKNGTLLIKGGLYWQPHSLIELSDSGTVICAATIDSSNFTHASFISGGRIILTSINGSMSLLDSLMHPVWSSGFNTDSTSLISCSSVEAIARGDSAYWILGNFSSFSFSEGSFIICTDTMGNYPCYMSFDTIYTTPATITVNSANAWQEYLIPFQISSKVHTYAHGITVSEICNVNVLYGIEKLELNIFPNPTSSSFTISGNSISKQCQLEIHNLLGEKIYSSSYGEPMTVNIEHLPPGIYFVTLESESGIAVQKLIKL